jgi:DNA-directed RNA polymerase specialized sigma24 family protein
MDFRQAERVWREQTAETNADDYIEAVRFCIEELDPKKREAIELKYWHAASRQVMARRLGMTLDGIKTLLQRTHA